MKEVVEGWVTRDYGPITALGLKWGKVKVWPKFPYRDKVGLFWRPNFPQDIEMLELPKEYCQEQSWEDEPRRVKITIETIDRDMKELLHKLCYLPRHQYRKECVMYLAHIFSDGTLFFLDCSSTLQTPPFDGIREATLEEIKVAYETECRLIASDSYDFQG